MFFRFFMVLYYKLKGAIVQREKLAGDLDGTWIPRGFSGDLIVDDEFVVGKESLQSIHGQITLGNGFNPEYKYHRMWGIKRGLDGFTIISIPENGLEPMIYALPFRTEGPEINPSLGATVLISEGAHDLLFFTGKAVRWKAFFDYCEHYSGLESELSTREGLIKRLQAVDENVRNLMEEAEQSAKSGRKIPDEHKTNLDLVLYKE